MGNSISNFNQQKIVSLSNGATSVLYEVILLAGSKIAKTTWEKKIMIWIAERDQSIVGLGIVGFDITKLGWSKSKFYQQKEFMITILSNAIKNKEWKKLDYNPNEEIITNKLKEVLDIFENLMIDEISEEKRKWYKEPSDEELNQKCKIHNIYLNNLSTQESQRCQLCNNN